MDPLISEAAAGGRQVNDTELQELLEHVAQAGFAPGVTERTRGRLSGVVWKGAVLTGREMLPPAEVHFLWHVVVRQEWPRRTALDEYLASIRTVILDPTSRVFVCRYQSVWQLGTVRESRELRGPRGHDWVLVQYRVGWGHWVTAFQPEQGLDELLKPQWSDVRWLRQPMRSSML